MVIKRTSLFRQQFFDIVFYIAKDKVSASQNFKSDINKLIKELLNFPFKYRKSYYYENENIRDLIYKGYSIIYKVDLEKSEIVVLEIFNQNLPQLEG
ncbi:MAG: type II toxin-antitoxin system RelE/ParE family toxin [Arcobacteraceae bacterium]